MLKRILSAVPIIIVVALAAIFQSWVMVALAVALALATQFEIVRAFDRNGKPVTAYLSYAFAVVLAAFFAGFLFCCKGLDYTSWMPLMLLCAFVVLIMLVFIVSMFSKRHTGGQRCKYNFHLCLSPAFPCAFLSAYFRKHRRLLPGMLVVFLMVLVPAMLSDTFAYFIGMAFGKRKLCPQISPKKTVAAASAVVGGL